MLAPSFERIETLNPTTVYVGLSGGVDSVVLLHLVREAFGSERVAAIHVRHGLHADADRWQQACEVLCERLSVKCLSRQVTVAPAGSLEASAREARYRVFEEIVGDSDVLLLAHHRDDQVETILHTLFRGSARFGVTGMPAERKLGRGWLLRPLIDARRDDIVEYAKAHGLSWQEDPSNRDESHTRNFIRHTLLPALESQWPNARETLLEAMNRDAAARELIDSIAKNDLADAVRGYGIDVGMVAALPPARRIALIRYRLDSLGLPQPTQAALEQGLADLMTAREDAAPQLSWQGICLRRYRGGIYVGCEHSSGAPESVPLDAGEIVFGEGLLTLPKSNEGILLCQRDDYVAKVRSEGMEVRARHTRSIKKVMQESGIPPWLREHVPVICVGDTVAALPALPEWGVSAVIADNFAPKEGEPGLSVSFRMAGEPYSD